MYAGAHVVSHAERPVFIMAESGESVTYAQFEQRTNRLAHLLRSIGLSPYSHYAIFMENNAHYLEACGAGARAGLYYTCVNSYLLADELAYIVNNSESQVLITSQSRLDVAREALTQCPNVHLCLVVDGTISGSVDEPRIRSYAQAVAGHPARPLADEFRGAAMLYSSGTTGRPKGILRAVPKMPPSERLPLQEFLLDLWQYRADMIYLSPAPLYHSAPQSAVSLAIEMGGTVIIMERFDPERYLQLVEQYRVTHSQLVPTMFNRLLKLPEDTRAGFDLSSLEFAVHAAAPCPVQIKEQMIDWWGPIIHEYYGATEAMGFTACDSHEWLAHRGSVGKVIMGDLHILDESMQPLAQGTPGEIWFKSPAPFVYFNDPERTSAARSADGSMSTVGDIGYVDEDGFLYLTDRATFMIISGGVNIYPQECENLLITHPMVADAAVFGVPNEDLGEEVKAVIEVLPGVTADADLVTELLQFCSQHLARMKCPRSIDFIDVMPRLPTGKLYKRTLKDKYWAGHAGRIL